MSTGEQLATVSSHFFEAGPEIGHPMGMTDDVSIPRADAIAVSRLLWSIGSESTTSHQHKVDCFHWGAVLDHASGLPPHPTPGHPTVAVREFYEGVRDHINAVIASLEDGGA